MRTKEELEKEIIKLTKSYEKSKGPQTVAIRAKIAELNWVLE